MNQLEPRGKMGSPAASPHAQLGTSEPAAGKGWEYGVGVSPLRPQPSLEALAGQSSLRPS